MPTPASGSQSDLEVRPFSIDGAGALSRELGLPWPVASLLARRGFEDPGAAADFIAADVTHPASDFEGVDSIAARILEAVDEGLKITIYGDYDCDGVCATTILVQLLRELGADCDWFIPDRMTEGYGLNPDAVRRLAERGSNLVVTVDCGISSPDEVDLARELGLEMIITDHHRFGERLPDCPILHPEVSGYPFYGLCGAAVAWKLAEEIRRTAGKPEQEGERDLDLVALATVADVMPLVDENRTLVRKGLSVIRRADRQGMRALLDASSVEPTTIRAGDLGFRLGPRVNAIGRIHRADAGVELFLTADPERASEIGSELSRANSERRRIEREVETEVNAALRADERADPSVLVAAGEGWHPGVLGIVAARVSRARRLPTVVLGIEEGVARGSARGLPGVDLHGALSEASDHLIRFGGHKAAAGLSLEVAELAPFREALDRAVAEQTGGGPIPERVVVDCFLAGEDLDMKMAEAIEDLEPFGNGNSAPTVLIPDATVIETKPLSEGRHSRLTIASGGRRCSGIAFGRDGSEFRPEVPVDLIGRFSINHWKGSSEPQFDLQDVASRESLEGGDLELTTDEEWWGRFEDRLVGESDDAEGETQEESALDPVAGTHGSGAGGIAGIASSGEGVLVLTAEAFRRWRRLGGGRSLARFLPDGERSGVVAGAWAGSPAGALDDLEGEPPSILITDYESLHRCSGYPAPGSFPNVLLFDPPAGRGDWNLVGSLGGRVHVVLDPTCLDFALSASAERHDPVPAMRIIYAALRDGGPIEGSVLRALLQGPETAPRPPERSATLLRIMIEAGIARTEGNGPDRRAEAVSSGEVNLDDSAEYRRQSGIHKEQIAFLRRSDTLVAKK